VQTPQNAAFVVKETRPFRIGKTAPSAPVRQDADHQERSHRQTEGGHERQQSQRQAGFAHSKPVRPHNQRPRRIERNAASHQAGS